MKAPRPITSDDAFRGLCIAYDLHLATLVAYVVSLNYQQNMQTDVNSFPTSICVNITFAGVDRGWE